MKSLLTVTACLLAAALLGGCDVIAYQFAPPPPEKTVQAEYSDLPGHKLAIVVWTRESTELEDPDLPMDLAGYVRQGIKTVLDKNMTFISQERIAQYKRSNLRWADIPPAELGRKFGADMTLYIGVDYYVPSSSGQGRSRGKIACSCAVYDHSRAHNDEKVWSKPDISIEYPDREVGEGAAVIPGQIRKELLTRFSAKLIDCFRKHKEPADES